MYSSHLLALQIVVFICPTHDYFVEGVACLDKEFVGVANPWEFQFGRDIKSKENRAYLMLDDSYRITCCGYVIGWQFQASFRAQIRPIDFQIWRPVLGDSQRHFLLIGQHSVWYMKEKIRTVEVLLQKQEFILVQNGDVIGWHTPLGDVIDYATTVDRGDSKYFMIQDTSSFSIGQNLTVAEEASFGRAYSIKVILAAAPPSQRIHLQRKVTFECPIEESHHVTTVAARPFLKQDNITYTIDSYSPWFEINQTSGEIRTATALKGNLTTDITILVTSTCGVRTSSLLMLQCLDVDVTIEDKRDTSKKLQEFEAKSPTSENMYHVIFRESVTSETVLRTVLTNTTNQTNAICIISGTQPVVPSSVLYTSGNSLLIKSLHNLLFNMTPIVYVNLTCIHTDGRTSEEMVVIHVIKDLEPVFSNLPALVEISARSASVHDVIFRVNASDRDGQMLTFDMANCSCPLTVKKDGSVILIADPRLIPQESFIIKLFLSDGFNTVGPADLHVLITDMNHPPQFVHVPHELVVPENTEGVVLTIQSHDPDSGDSIIVLWAWENINAVKYFTFNDSATQLYISAEIQLDYEIILKTMNKTSFVLLLTLSDGFLTSDTERVSIHVTDVNEEPSFLVHRMNTSCKEGKAGSIVLESQIQNLAIDPDIDDVLTFHLVPGPLSDMFAVDRVFGQVTFSSDFDMDSSRLPGNVHLKIKVVDSGGLWDEIEVFLNVQNVNVPPVIHAPSSVMVPEDVSGGTLLFMTSASDWDSDDMLSLTILCTDCSDKLFNYIDSGAVILKVNASLDYETSAMFTFQAQADDGHMTSQPVFTLLHVLDVNEAPISLQDHIFIEMPEGKAGTAVPGLEMSDVCTDPDGDSLTFNILQENDTDWSFFLISPISGWLLLTQDVDVTRQMSPLFLTVSVVAKDHEQLSATVMIEVKLYFVNTRPTILGLPAEVTVLENTPKHQTIFRVVTSDADNDNLTLRFQMDQGNATANSVLVNISSGEIKYVGQTALSQDQIVEMSIVFTAFDGETTSTPRYLKISVVGINEPPSFLRAEYRFYINESQTGTNLTTSDTWSDIDPDPGDTLMFVIMGGKDRDYVLVDTATGIVKVMDGYDIDVPGNPRNLTFGLMVRDFHGLNATTTIFISIKDINDNKPVVENGGETFFINCSVLYDHRIGQIEAIDLDSGKNGVVTFSIVGSTLDVTANYFVILRNGWILSTGQIPEVNHTTLYIAVSDGGWPANVVMTTAHVIFLKSVQETLSSSLLQSENLGRSDKRGDDGNEESIGILILIILTATCVIVIMILSYHLWKAKKLRRSTQPEQQHDAYHDYQFQWVPTQIDHEDMDECREPQPDSGAISPFFGTSVTNENYYEPGILSSSQRQVLTKCDFVYRSGPEEFQSEIHQEGDGAGHKLRSFTCKPNILSNRDTGDNNSGLELKGNNWFSGTNLSASALHSQQKVENTCVCTYKNKSPVIQRYFADDADSCTNVTQKMDIFTSTPTNSRLQSECGDVLHENSINETAARFSYEFFNNDNKFEGVSLMRDENETNSNRAYSQSQLSLNTQGVSVDEPAVKAHETGGSITKRNTTECSVNGNPGESSRSEQEVLPGQPEELTTQF